MGPGRTAPGGFVEIRTRVEWGAKAPKSRKEVTLDGPSTLHWNGSGTGWAKVLESARIQWMDARMRQVQAYHMGPDRNWSDFAYSFAVSPWGGVWEGRGLDVRSAAQGTTEGNDTSHAIYVPTGVGDPDVTSECVEAIDELVAWIASVTEAEDRAVAHRDWKSTTCPGDFLYSQLTSINTDDDKASMDPTTPGLELSNVVAMFWLDGGYGVASSAGEVQTFGSASHYGHLANMPLNGPIVDAESTESGKGYYLAASDGGVFCFGDAQFHGSMGGFQLNAPIIGLETVPGGYWLVAADGGIFTFGAAEFHGRPDVETS